MAWFRREHENAPDTAAHAPAADPDASPEQLRQTLLALNRFINQNSGRLPGQAVVDARQVTDTLADIIDTSDARALDVYAAISVEGTLTDYLPTTLKSFLAVDEHLVDRPRPSGRTPTQSLLEQIHDLQTSSSAVLIAARDQDADALITQGSFLRTKFSGSDLDL